MTKKDTIDTLEISKFAQLASQWWDKEGLLKTLHDINPARVSFINQFVRLSQKRVLDVGCGGGILCESMAAAGALVTGLDAEKDAIVIAKNHAQQTGLIVDYICQPLDNYGGQSFDVITCLEMLEHANDPALVIEHCYRLLRSGGWLFLSTINRTLISYASVIVAAEYILRLLPRQTHDYRKFIKPSELVTLTDSLGLQLIGISGIAYNPLSRIATLVDSVSANYIVACRKL